MKKSILNLGKALNKTEQKNINGQGINSQECGELSICGAEETCCSGICINLALVIMQPNCI